ncbi:MAG: hypothetical protein KGI73_02440 [Patescibacteria group bacterium]|nr:hypothetical protein [Patescibacteria group bacterium]
MDFLRDLFDSFIPHADNGYHPHFFRTHVLAFVAAVVFVVATATFSVQTFMLANNGSLAAVISSVLVGLTNTDRSANGMSSLSTSPLLTEAAQMKANDMAAKGYFAHTSPVGVTPWYWIDKAGYNYQFAGENLAVRFSDSVAVENAWMNSPDHRANILSGNFTQIGIATAEGNFQGQPAVFVVEMFGKPAAAPAAAAGAGRNVGVGTASPAPSASGAGAPAVAGTSTANESPKVITENAHFIAVENTATATASTAAAAPEAGATLAPGVSVVTTLATSPGTVATWIFLALAALIILALTFMIVVEFRHQHPKSVLMAASLLFIIIALIIFWQVSFPGQLMVG